MFDSIIVLNPSWLNNIFTIIITADPKKQKYVDDNGILNHNNLPWKSIIEEYSSFLNEIYIRLLLIVIVSLYFIKIIPFEWFMRFYLLIFISQLTILMLLIFKNEMKSFLIDWTVFNKKKIKELLSFSLTMALATIASIALRNIDILIIGIRI